MERTNANSLVPIQPFQLGRFPSRLALSSAAQWRALPCSAVPCCVLCCIYYFVYASIMRTSYRVQVHQFVFFSHAFTFQLLGKPWSQVSSLSPPGSCLQYLSRIGFSSPTARRFFIECCQLTLSRFPQVNLCARKSPHEFIRVCTRGDSNSRN